MRHYELMLIISDLLTEEDAQALVERVESLISEAGGTVEATDFWGKRPLAYEIGHRSAAYYVVYDFEIESSALPEIERQLKISDDVVRFKTLRPDLRVRKPQAPRARTYT